MTAAVTVALLGMVLDFCEQQGLLRRAGRRKPPYLPRRVALFYTPLRPAAPLTPQGHHAGPPKQDRGAAEDRPLDALARPFPQRPPAQASQQAEHHFRA